MDTLEHDRLRIAADGYPALARVEVRSRSRGERSVDHEGCVAV
jgi:hypothetical protein